MKLLHKIFIEGLIQIETGLHIGGAKAAMDIGGVDLAVIKTPDRKPYIPGSSLRGKLRSLYARELGSMAVSGYEIKGPKVPTDDDNSPAHKGIARIFGLPGKQNAKELSVTRLIVRDAPFEDWDPAAGIDQDFMEFGHTEVKWENRIDRKSGTAGDPRQLERVPAGAQFRYQMIYNTFDLNEEKEDIPRLLSLMRMLEDDYLGGHGSRGYGRVKFLDPAIKRRTMADYLAGTKATTIEDYPWKP
jgi:CRISPR-associated protein Csm3